MKKRSTGLRAVASKQCVEKRLLGNLKELKERLYELEPAATGQKENPFWT